MFQAVPAPSKLNRGRVVLWGFDDEMSGRFEGLKREKENDI